LVEIMMQTEDAKRGLKFSIKEMWLEVFLLGASVSTTWHHTAFAKMEECLHKLLGSTTMGPFVSALFSYLLHSPAKLDRLVAEIRALDSEADISIDGKLNQCEYLWACVDELFRLMPTITNPLFRTVLPGGVVITDRFFEQGIELGASTFEIHRNEKYFPDPHNFKPERFLGSAEEKKAAKKFWVPFSRGNRTCVGQSLAFMVTAQMVARVVWCCDVRLAPEACCGGVAEEEMRAHHEYD
jgi:cytochrome P450